MRNTTSPVLTVSVAPSVAAIRDPLTHQPSKLGVGGSIPSGRARMVEAPPKGGAILLRLPLRERPLFRAHRLRKRDA